MTTIACARAKHLAAMFLMAQWRWRRHRSRWPTRAEEALVVDTLRRKFWWWSLQRRCVVLRIAWRWTPGCFAFEPPHGRWVAGGNTHSSKMKRFFFGRRHANER